MHLVRVNQITVNQAGHETFRDLSWSIGDRDRIGLVGPNGAGKSTLLKALMGEVSLDDGNITHMGRVRMERLSQEIELDPTLTLYEAAMIIPPALAELEAKLDAVETRLTQPETYENDDTLAQVLEQQAELLEQYEQMKGSSHQRQVERLLLQFGFDASYYDLPTTGLSGGQKKLVEIVRLAAIAPNILLLDEPDNHLDSTGKALLEQFIHGYQGSVIIVSHDRYLLDEVATHIAELENGKLTSYHGNYSYYINERELQRLRQEQQYTTQQKQIAQIEAAIARFELWARMVEDERHIRQARSRRKMLERMEAKGEIIEKVHEQRLMGLSLAGGRGSKLAIRLQQVGMAFDEQWIFRELDLLVRHGERTALVGANGVGKSVIFKLILGEYEPSEGIITVGPSTRIGYYSQEHQTLDEWVDKTPLDLIRWHKLGGEGEAVSFLLKMAFQYQQVHQPIRTLSGGERARLQLAILMLQQPNLLLLDEPTNHLDIASIEVLEDALDNFEGTVFTISHDRYFLDKVVDRVIALVDGELHEYLGGYTDYAAAQSV